MNFLVVGAHGYIGRHLCRALCSENQVFCLCREKAARNSLPEQCEALDWNDLNEGAGKGVAFDAVINCSGCYGRSGESDAEVVEINVMYGLRVLEMATQQKIPFFLNIGTALSPKINTYTFSKRQFSEWGAFYAECGKINFVDLCFEHFYGPGDCDCRKFIVYVIKALQNNVAELNLTPGEQLRDFVFIDDAVRAIVTVLKHLSECHDYTRIPVGSGTALRIREIVEKLKEIIPTNTVLRWGAIPYRKYECMYSCADISILKAWGWQPEIDFETGIHATVEYFQCGY